MSINGRCGHLMPCVTRFDPLHPFGDEIVLRSTLSKAVETLPS
jgi:hypothetical protein